MRAVTCLSAKIKWLGQRPLSWIPIQYLQVGVMVWAFSTSVYISSPIQTITCHVNAGSFRCEITVVLVGLELQVRELQLLGQQQQLLELGKVMMYLSPHQIAPVRRIIFIYKPLVLIFHVRCVVNCNSKSCLFRLYLFMWSHLSKSDNKGGCQWAWYSWFSSDNTCQLYISGCQWC